MDRTNWFEYWKQKFNGKYIHASHEEMSIPHHKIKSLSKHSLKHQVAFLKSYMKAKLRMEWDHETNIHKLESKETLASLDAVNNNTHKVVVVAESNKTILNRDSDANIGQTRYVLLASTYRSGSSVLGELLSQYPGTFYTCEPLMKIDYDLNLKSDTKKIYSEQTRQTFIKLLLDIFKCHPEKKHFKYGTTGFSNHFKFNFRLWNVCQVLCPGCSIKKASKKCSLSKLYYSTCPMFPIRLIKTVRLRVQETEKLLLHHDIGKSLKIVFLVRDPRGMMKSRLFQSWCNFPLCYDPSLFCKDLLNNILAAYQLKEKYPSK